MAVNLKQLEDQISSLNAEQLKQFRAWYEKFDSENWDKQIELDAEADRFRDIANEALAEHRDGKTKRI